MAVYIKSSSYEYGFISHFSFFVVVVIVVFGFFDFVFFPPQIRLHVSGSWKVYVNIELSQLLIIFALNFIQLAT